MARWKFVIVSLLGIGLSQINANELPEDAGVMIYIPAGKLWFGEYEGLGIEPVWEIDVHSFYIDKYEVSNAEYRAFIQSSKRPTHADAGEWFNNPSQPAVGTWEDARDYCEWAGKRLPTEVEWERAAEGNDGRRFPWGDRIDFTAMNWGDGSQGDGTKDGYVFTAPIDAYPHGVSPFGAYNMAGNVWEWVNDWYQKDYLDQEPLHLLGASSGTERVIRGGAWDTSTNFTRTSRQGRLTPAYWYADIGFRCAADVPPDALPPRLSEPYAAPQLPKLHGPFEPFNDLLDPHRPMQNFLNGPNYEVGPGVALSDYDDDGDLDIFTTNTLLNTLYANRSEAGKIKLELTNAGINDTSDQWTGAAFADYDNDGIVDLYVGNFFGANALYRGVGGGQFKKIQAEADNAIGTTAGVAFGDPDNDGDLDLMVANYFLRIGEPLSVHNVFYENVGGRFFDRSNEVGVATEGRSFQPLFFDFDHDGWSDLYVVNDFGPNELYHNRGHLNFTDIGEASSSADPGSGMGGALGDYDNDGDLDIYVTNFGVNTLFSNNRDGTFAEVAEPAGVNDVYVGWGTEFFDYDNDGDQDLYVVNGGLDWNVQLGRYSYAPNIFYVNDDDRGFIDGTNQLEVGNSFGGRGLAVGDLDGDGYQDMVVLNIDSKPVVYRNKGGDNNWLKIKPRGTISNRDGIGATARVVAGGFEQYQEVICGSSYLSQSSTELDFGLGSAETVDLVEVRWPASGAVQRWTNLDANQVLVALETAGTTIVNQGNTTVGAHKLAQNYPNPFNTETRIEFAVPEYTSSATLTVYNIAGQVLRQLLNDTTLTGLHSVIWDGRDNAGRDLASGVYFYRLSTDHKATIKSMVLLR